MADFISLHKEEWVALITGLEFSAMAAQTKALFIPVVIVILGLSLLIWLYRLEREKVWDDFIFWLIFSSIIIVSAFKTQKVVVELNPAILNSKSMLLSPNVKRENMKIDEKKGVIRYWADASGISALLAIPDKIASLMFNFMDAQLLRKLAGHSNTIPLDNVACQDPRYLTGVIHTLVLSEVFSLTDEKGQDVQDFGKKLRAFESCYRNNFQGQTQGARFEFSGEKLKRHIVRGFVGGAEIGRKLGIPLVDVGFGIVGSVVGIFSGLRAMIEDTPVLDCQVFIDQAYKPLAQQLAKRCKAILGGNYNEEAAVDAVVACITKPSSIEYCSDLQTTTLEIIGQIRRMSDPMMGLSGSGWWGNIKNEAAMSVSDAKAWWFSTTYMDFPLKFDLLAKGQGIVLAILTGMFPFIAVLSVIPVGRHFMNWPLLLNFMIAYFLVKMWIPLLFFIVSVAGHRLGGFAVGG